MLTEKQVKKAVNLAEGFEFHACDPELPVIDYVASHVSRSTLYENIREWEHYPLLLSRAKDAWNSNNDEDKLFITVDPFNIFVSNMSKDISVHMYCSYIPTKYLTAQEQALEAALEEVL